MSEIEGRLPLGDGSGNKVRLSETRTKREHESASDPAKIALDELQHAAIFEPERGTSYP